MKKNRLINHFMHNGGLLSSRSVCAPGKRLEHGTCLTHYSLQKIASYINNKHGKIEIQIDADKKIMLDNIKNYLNCRDDECIISHKYIIEMNDADIIQYTLRHTGPKNTQWLSTIDINRVLDQYNHINKDFIFLGAVPIDFKNLPFLGVSNLDLNQLQNESIHKLAIVFNLDEHYKSGSHWVALYSDLKKKKIYFFDSNGIKPEYRIRSFMIYIIKYLMSKYSIDISNMDISHNPVRHQYKNSECGVYSINFIIRCLKGETYKSIQQDKMHDDDMQLCRNVYFS